jgi:hypothetical protein
MPSSDNKPTAVIRVCPDCATLGWRLVKPDSGELRI